MGTTCAICGEVVFRQLETKVRIVLCKKDGHTVKLTEKQSNLLKKSGFGNRQYKKGE